MSQYNNSALWDLSLPPSLPTLPDDEFIALLQKQFGALPGGMVPPSKEQGGQTGNVDPQNLTSFPIQGVTARSVSPPPSEDSSPSPPSTHDNARSRRQSDVNIEGRRLQHERDGDEPMIKRKASEEDLDDEPSYKSQHTSSAKKGSSARRKSTGNPGGDESRLLKRKEQNRAAQRAFRERKEKHVKDLEDKVAALEEKNSTAQAENENLREVITRLQSENMRLRESNFTFAVPHSNNVRTQRQGSVTSTQPEGRRDSSMALFSPSSSVASSATPSTHDSPQSLFLNDKVDQPQLNFFGQSGLHIIEPEPQQTATSDAMGLDFGFGPPTSDTPYTTIASNPLFMSFREPDPFPMDTTSPGTNPLGAQQSVNAGSFAFTPNYNSWPDINMNDTQSQAFDLTNSLDELFGGAYMGPTGPLDYNFKDSVSPISHHNSKSPSSTSSSGASPGSTINAASSGSSPQVGESGGCSGGKCSKENIAACIAADEGSVFAPKPSPKSEQQAPQTVHLPEGPEFVPCKGLQLPKTQKSDKNLEVMKAWRTLRADPKFQDVDINELCTEFASKARCDGHQVVIEPQGMLEILDSVNKRNGQN